MVPAPPTAKIVPRPFLIIPFSALVVPLHTGFQFTPSNWSIAPLSPTARRNRRNRSDAVAVPVCIAIPAVPLTPLTVAEMVADPFATPVASPLGSTVATVPSLVLQVTVFPGSTAPALSLAVAVNCTVCPRGRQASGGVTVTDARPLPPPPPPPPLPPPWWPPAGILHEPKISPVTTHSRASVRVIGSSCGGAHRAQKNRPSESIAQSVSRFAPLEAWAIRTAARPGVRSV